MTVKEGLLRQGLSEWRIISNHVRERHAVLPDGAMVYFDEAGVSEPLEESTATTACRVPGFGLFSSPVTEPDAFLARWQPEIRTSGLPAANEERPHVPGPMAARNPRRSRSR